MAVITKGTTFSTGDQVTASGLNNLADSATFASGAVDSTTTQLSGGAIIVKDSGISTAKLADSTGVSDGVTFAKLQQAAANTVLVRDANSTGVVSAKAVADTQILIGDGTGFTAAALSGDVTMTNAGVANIEDDVALGGNPTTTTQSAGNNSTRIATTAYVDNAVPSVQVAEFTKSSGTLNATGLITGYSESDPGGIAAESSGTITVTGAGTYLVNFQGTFSEDGSGSFGVQYQLDSANVLARSLDAQGEGGIETLSYSVTKIISSGTFTVAINGTETGSSTLTFAYVRINIVKLA